jgi:hypothetical protein
MERRVSGRKRAMHSRQTATMMTMDQKMDRHPKLCESAPPMAGAMQGASMGPRLNMPKYPPLSLLVDMSPMTPAPRAMVLALPPDWKHRRKSRSQKWFVGQSARPMLDATRMPKQTR